MCGLRVKLTYDFRHTCTVAHWLYEILKREDELMFIFIVKKNAKSKLIRKLKIKMLYNSGPYIFYFGIKRNIEPPTHKYDNVY